MIDIVQQLICRGGSQNKEDLKYFYMLSRCGLWRLQASRTATGGNAQTSDCTVSCNNLAQETEEGEYNIGSWDLFNAVLLTSPVLRIQEWWKGGQVKYKSVAHGNRTRVLVGRKLEKERKKLNKTPAELDRLFSSYEDKVMERTPRILWWYGEQHRKEQSEIS